MKINQCNLHNIRFKVFVAIELCMYKSCLQKVQAPAVALRYASNVTGHVVYIKLFRNRIVFLRFRLGLVTVNV